MISQIELSFGNNQEMGVDKKVDKYYLVWQIGFFECLNPKKPISGQKLASIVGY